jgi:hypothetical protein
MTALENLKSEQVPKFGCQCVQAAHASARPLCQRQCTQPFPGFDAKSRRVHSVERALSVPKSDAGSATVPTKGVGRALKINSCEKKENNGTVMSFPCPRIFMQSQS